MNTVIPEGYKSILSVYDTQKAIGLMKRLFEDRFAAVLNDSIAQQGVAGSFGWCMADYNTHREFGSGDRICYHGVLDSFRNPKLSAAVYASQKTPRPPSDIVLEVSSSMALGDLPGGFAGACWVFTNAESVRLYRGNDFIAEFSPDLRGRFFAARSALSCAKRE